MDLDVCAFENAGKTYSFELHLADLCVDWRSFSNAAYIVVNLVIWS